MPFECSPRSTCWSFMAACREIALLAILLHLGSWVQLQLLLPAALRKGASISLRTKLRDYGDQLNCKALQTSYQLDQDPSSLGETTKAWRTRVKEKFVSHLPKNKTDKKIIQKLVSNEIEKPEFYFLFDSWLRVRIRRLLLIFPPGFWNIFQTNLIALIARFFDDSLI